ncbi:MAG: DUF2207 domain-containing protein [Gemmatimonadales bacterium]|nr:MAG: DUF2207 domain-containing protein [Gemmatimonadales bacterium]
MPDLSFRTPPSPSAFLAFLFLVCSGLSLPLPLLGSPSHVPVAEAVRPTLEEAANPPSQEAERSYGIEGFRVELELTEDGSYHITESMDFVYEGGTYSQGFRTIPLRGLDAVTDVRVSSPEVQVDGVEVRERGRSVDITWDFEPRGEPTTFVLRYRVEGALQEVEGWNRIAWDAVGDAWEVPVQGLDVRVRWPDFGLDEGAILFVPEEEGRLGRWGSGAAGADEGGGVTGPTAGSEGAGGGGWEVRFQRAELDARTPYGVQVAFPAQLPGRAPPEPPEDRFPLFLLGLGGMLAGLLPGVALMLKWRDPGDPPTRIPDGVPDVPLHHTGFLTVDAHTWYLRTATALLVDLARRGHVRLERTEAEGERQATTKSGGLAPGELVVQRVTPHPEGDPLTDAESGFLTALDEHDTFQDFLAKSPWRSEAYGRTRRELLEEGSVEHHPERRNGAIGASLLLPLGLVGAALVIPRPSISAVLIGGALTAAIGLGLAAYEGRYQLSEKGARLRAWIRARQEEFRGELEAAVESDPAQGARLLAEHLPLLLLDPKLSHTLLRELEEAVQEAGGELELPGWIRRAAGGGGPGTEEGDDLLLFLFILWISQSSQPQMQASSGGAGIPGGGFSGGAGVSTSVGGGGGGMR